MAARATAPGLTRLAQARPPSGSAVVDTVSETMYHSAAGRRGPPRFTLRRSLVSVRLYVGNLSFRLTADEVGAAFARVVPVESVYLPVDRQTGRPRG